MQDTSGPQAEVKPPILHVYSDYQGSRLDFYTDGTNWRSAEAVQAALAEGKGKEQSEAPERNAISSVPAQRDLGDNAFGENPRLQLGDTRDRRTFGEMLLEEDSDPDETRLERLGNKYRREVGEVNDAVKDEVDNIRNALTHPRPAGNAEVLVRHGPTATPHQGLEGGNPGSVAQLIVVGAALGTEAYRWAHRKVNEIAGRHSASHE